MANWVRVREPATAGPGYATFATTGHTNHPSWPGSFTGGTNNGEVTVTGGSTVNFADFKGGTLVGTSGVHITTPVVFNGCRFQFSANVSDQGDATSFHALLFANATGLITFNYCTFQPSVTNYPTRLTGEEVQGDASSWVSYGKSYQFALVGDGAYATQVAGGLVVDHCDFWGFGNAFQLAGSTVAKPHIVRDSIFHHGGDPFVVNNSGGQFHNDCWLVNNGGYQGAQCVNNAMEIWGNTNLLAWQGAGNYNDAIVTGNLFGGDQQSISLSASGTSQRITFTDNWYSTRIGRSVGDGTPLRSWAVSDSGSGSIWRRNKLLVGAGSLSANYPGAKWGNVAQNGNYWHPGDTDTTLRSGTVHASDYTG